MLTGERNKMRNLWLGLATVIFALAVAPTNASAQRPIAGQTTIDPTRHVFKRPPDPCSGDKALEPACLKRRLDGLDQFVTQMSENLDAAQGTLKELSSQLEKLRSQLNGLSHKIGDPKEDATNSNLWQAIRDLRERLAAHGW